MIPAAVQPSPALTPTKRYKSLLLVGPFAAATLGALVAVLALTGCHRGSSPSVVTDTGISGVTMAAPQCPVERQDSPCPARPVSARIIVKDGSGTEVTAFNSGADGRFRVVLPAGQYVLVTADQMPPTLAPKAVTVVTGQFTEIELTLDTGIR
jgi:hypothetical protein